MAVFKNLLAVTIALVGMAHAAPNLESRQALPPVGWDYFGCWSDNVNARTLKGASTTDATAMSIEKCIGFCASAPGKFNLAGVEFAKECYCGNAIDNGSSIISSSKCNLACTGNGLQLCGGANSIGLYRFEF